MRRFREKPENWIINLFGVLTLSLVVTVTGGSLYLFPMMFGILIE